MGDLMYRIASQKFEDPADGEDVVQQRLTQLETDLVDAFRALEDEFR